jgi:type VI secretion system protein VasD
VTVASERLLPTILLSLLGLIVAACAAKEPPPPPPPTLVELSFAGADDLNPDSTGRASPLVVRYYQLGGTNAFERADYFQIHDKEAALLGPDLLARDELPLAPGAAQKASFEGKSGIKFLGVIASYRDIDNAVWRANVPIPPNKTTKLKVQLDKLKLSIAPDAE